MAATTTQGVYDMIGIREDLFDPISNIAPTATPFQTMVQKGKAATNNVIEFMKDTLASANGNNAVIEGADPSFLTATAIIRLKNRTQLMDKGIKVSDSGQAVNTAGRDKELAYQAMKRTKELKNDWETRLTNNYASVAGTNATVRKAASFEAWITTNDFNATGIATSGGFVTATGIVSAAVLGTSSLRTVTEARLKAPIKQTWDNGGEPDTMMVGSWNKQQISGFSGIATKYNVASRNNESNVIVGAADLYASDFGVYKVVPNRRSRAGAVLGIDASLWSQHYLQPFQTAELAKTGHADKRMLFFEASLASRNETGNWRYSETTVS